MLSSDPGRLLWIYLFTALICLYMHSVNVISMTSRCASPSWASQRDGREWGRYNHVLLFFLSLIHFFLTFEHVGEMRLQSQVEAVMI